MKRFERYLLIYSTDGSETARYERDGRFAAVKGSAIHELSRRLETTHGRGDHTLRMYGMIEVPTMLQVGANQFVQNGWTWAQDELVFSL